MSPVYKHTIIRTLNIEIISHSKFRRPCQKEIRLDCTGLYNTSEASCTRLPSLVMWAQPRHLATPGLATWRSPGGDQNFLKWGGERVASRMLRNLFVGMIHTIYTTFLPLEMSKKGGYRSTNLFTPILHPLVIKKPQNDGICSVTTAPPKL